MLATDRSHDADVEVVLEPCHVVGIASGGRYVVVVCRRGDEQVGRPSSGLAAGGTARRGEQPLREVLEQLEATVAENRELYRRLAQ